MTMIHNLDPQRIHSPELIKVVKLILQLLVVCFWHKADMSLARIDFRF
jgi:hypothetical protein